MSQFNSRILRFASLSCLLLACENSTFHGASKSAAQADQPIVGTESTVQVDEASSPKAQTGGVIGGHFDLDTSTATYPLGQGKTDHHVHQYDDKFQTTGVDYFHMLDAAFLAVNQVVAAEKKFNIIVANSRLSTGARLAINGKIYLASDWESKETQRVFSLSGVAGTEKLSSFSVLFDPLKDISEQLIPTSTGLVQAKRCGSQWGLSQRSFNDTNNRQSNHDDRPCPEGGQNR